MGKQRDRVHGDFIGNQISQISYEVNNNVVALVPGWQCRTTVYDEYVNLESDNSESDGSDFGSSQSEGNIIDDGDIIDPEMGSGENEEAAYKESVKGISVDFFITSLRENIIYVFILLDNSYNLYLIVTLV